MLGKSLEKNPDHIKLFHDTLSRLQKQEASDLESTIEKRSKELIAKGKPVTKYFIRKHKILFVYPKLDFLERKKLTTFL